MELSAEAFQQVVNSVKGDAATGAVDRRQHPRVGLRCKVQIIPIENGVPGKPFEVWTRDVSRGGIGVVTHTKMKVGKRFGIRLASDDADTAPTVLLCTVRNCFMLSEGSFAIGATFESVERKHHATASVPAAATATPAAPSPAPAAPSAAA